MQNSSTSYDTILAQQSDEYHLLQVIPVSEEGQPAPVSSIIASSSNSSVLTTTVIEDKIKINTLKTGNATVNITAQSQAGDSKTLQVQIAVKTVFDYLIVVGKEGEDANGYPYAYYEDGVALAIDSNSVTFDSLNGTGTKNDVNITQTGVGQYTLMALPDATTNCYFDARLKIENKLYGTGRFRFILNPSGGYNLQNATIKCYSVNTEYEGGTTINTHIGDLTNLHFRTIPDVYCKASNVTISATSSNTAIVRVDTERELSMEMREIPLTILQVGTSTITATIADANGYTKTETFIINVEANE